MKIGNIVLWLVLKPSLPRGRCKNMGCSACQRSVYIYTCSYEKLYKLKRAMKEETTFP
jgi:hypothetical protein